ncbi:MAG: hypothetical protein Kapaf2KO_13570 [Candidatus Kapaibacteriales bacterium]
MKTIFLVFFLSPLILLSQNGDMTVVKVEKKKTTYPYLGATIGLPGIINLIGGYNGEIIRGQLETSLFTFANWQVTQGTLGFQLHNNETSSVSLGPALGYIDITFFNRVQYLYAGGQLDVNFYWFHLDLGGFYAFNEEDVGFIPKLNIGFIYRFND